MIVSSVRARPEPARRSGMLLLAALLVAGLSAGLPVSADTTIGGPVTTNTALLLSNSPYLVTSDLVVQNGATLSIQPGVTLLVAPGVDIVVQSGSLRSDGTDAAPVVITSASDGTGAPAPGDWGALRFENGTNDAGTRLRNTTVRYGTGLELVGASPALDYVRLESLAGPAITIDLASFPRGLGNSAVGCGLNGILVPAGDITQQGSWALRGIPYVVRGRVSVGQSPRIDSVTPSTIQRLDTVDVTVAGQRLSGASAFAVDGGGVTAAIQPGGSATGFVVRLQVAQDAALGARAFRATTPAGIVESADLGLAITVAAAVPVLDAIAPATITGGGGSFVLTANGHRFDAGAEIVVADTPLVTTRISATQLTGSVPASLIAVPGNLDVVVRNPDPTSPGAFLVSPPRTLTVVAPQIDLSPDPLVVIVAETANLVLSIPYNAPAGGLTFALVSANTSVASVPDSVTIAQGTASVPVTVTGGTTGTTTITASRAGFIDGTAQIDVVPPPILIPITPLVARAVGVQVGPPPGGGTDQFPVAPLAAPRLGLTVGAVLDALSPDRVAQGATGVNVTATGQGLDQVTAVRVEPGDGLVVGSPTNVAPDGTSLEFLVTVDPAAAPTLRRVLLETATGVIRTASPEVDRLLVTRGTPEVTSILPLEVVPGSVVTLFVRGRNLHAASAVAVLPADDLIVSSPPAVDATGTEVTVSLQALPAAALGDRTIVVTTPGGSSSATPAAANTLHVVAALGTTFTPLPAPPVGVQVGPVVTPEPQPEPVGPRAASTVGVVLGSAVTAVTPPSAIIGATNLAVTIEGVGLQDVDEVSFDPPDGITINGTPVVAGDGSSVALDVTIAADAPTGMRFVRVEAGATPVPAASARANRFLVTLPPPLITALIPIRGELGQTLSLTVHGQDLSGATSIAFEPADGVSIQNPPVVAADGRSASVTVIVGAAAPVGFRVVRITTPGGTSTATASVANTFEIDDQVGTTFVPLAAPPVGVQVGAVVVPEPQPEPVGPFVAPPVGVVIPTTAQPAPDFVVQPFAAPRVGVLLGSAVTGSSPEFVAPGTASFDLTLTGIGLDDVTAVELRPTNDVTVNGPPIVAPDGTSLTVNLSIALGAARGHRRALALTAGGIVPVLEPGLDLLYVGRPPELASITPNVVAIGSIFTLTVNGTDLGPDPRVALLPSEGATIGPATVNAAGTQLTVAVALAGSITPGARVVTVTTSAGASSTGATAANTLTIVGGGLVAEPVAAFRAPAAPSADDGVPVESPAPVPVRTDANPPAGRVDAGTSATAVAVVPVPRRVDSSLLTCRRSSTRLVAPRPAVATRSRENEVRRERLVAPSGLLTSIRLARPPDVLRAVSVDAPAAGVPPAHTTT